MLKWQARGKGAVNLRRMLKYFLTFEPMTTSRKENDHRLFIFSLFPNCARIVQIMLFFSYSGHSTSQSEPAAPAVQSLSTQPQGSQAAFNTAQQVVANKELQEVSDFSKLDKTMPNKIKYNSVPYTLKK